MTGHRHADFHYMSLGFAWGILTISTEPPLSVVTATINDNDYFTPLCKITYTAKQILHISIQKVFPWKLIFKILSIKTKFSKNELFL